MIRTEAPSYPISIFIAGRLWLADQVCRQYCDETGFCVTTTRTMYIYTEGQEPGVIIGLINYPRFPKTPAQIWAHAEALAERLRVELEQESYSIQAPDKTVWVSYRPSDQTPIDGTVKGS